MATDTICYLCHKRPRVNGRHCKLCDHQVKHEKAKAEAHADRRIRRGWINPGWALPRG